LPCRNIQTSVNEKSVLPLTPGSTRDSLQHGEQQQPRGKLHESPFLKKFSRKKKGNVSPGRGGNSDPKGEQTGLSQGGREQLWDDSIVLGVDDYETFWTEVRKSLVEDSCRTGPSEKRERTMRKKSKIAIEKKKRNETHRAVLADEPQCMGSD